MRFADTDAMGVVYHGTYLAYLEAGRVEAMRQVGAEYAAVVRQGVHLVAVEAHVKYRQPASFDDVLLVYTRAASVGRARFSYVYEVRRERDDALIVTGETVHAAVDGTTLRPIRLPDGVLQAVRRLEAATA